MAKKAYSIKLALDSTAC